jgi:hypothetical protein
MRSGLLCRPSRWRRCWCKRPCVASSTKVANLPYRAFTSSRTMLSTFFIGIVDAYSTIPVICGIFAWIVKRRRRPDGYLGWYHRGAKCDWTLARRLDKRTRTKRRNSRLPHSLHKIMPPAHLAITISLSKASLPSTEPLALLGLAGSAILTCGAVVLIPR